MPNRPNPDLSIIRASRAGVREAVLAQLGLIPAWAKDPAIGGQELLRPCSAEWLEAVLVNGTRHGGTALIQPEGQEPTQGKLL